MARVPTEVVAGAEVAGNGPPCTMACPTSTPVGQPLSDDPAGDELRDGNQALALSAASDSPRCTVGGELTFETVDDLRRARPGRAPARSATSAPKISVCESPGRPGTPGPEVTNS